MKKQFANGIIYIGIAKYSGLVISIVVSAILARLLPPSDFGTIAIITVIINFFSLLSELGIGPAIVQNKNITKTDINSLFSLTAFIALLFAIIFFLIAPAISTYYNNKNLLNISRLLSLVILFSTLNIVPNALLSKNKKFHIISIRTIFSQCISGALSIWAALSGCGIYSLLISPIISSFIILIINVYVEPIQFTFTIKKTSIKKIISFSAYQFLFNFINYFSRNIDKLLIGRYLGMTPLGFYEKSYRLVLLPLENISHVITPVLHPLFSEIQNDKERIYKGFLKFTMVLAYIGIPLSAFISSSAKEIILIIFGNQWHDAIRTFEILSYTIPFQLIYSPIGSILQSINKTNLLFWNGLLSSITSITLFLIGIFFLKTIELVSVCFCIISVLIFIFSVFTVTKLGFNKSFGNFITRLFPAFILWIILLISLYGINITLQEKLSLIPLLITKLAATFIICIFFVQIFEDNFFIKRIFTIIKCGKYNNYTSNTKDI